MIESGTVSRTRIQVITCHHVVEAFDVLDVQGRINVDTGAEQLLDIHVPLRVPASRGIGVGEFVDQNELRPAVEDGIEVHLFERMPFVLDASARNDFEAVQQRLGLFSTMRLHDADNRGQAPRGAWPQAVSNIS
jgi:hypothetical protein